MEYIDRDLNKNLLRLLPRVLRARDFRLYLEGGKRLVDLWLQGGRAVLGHKPPMVLRELKNAAERGLYSTLPHPMEGRFLKALEKIFPGKAFRLYLDTGSLGRALAAAGFTGDIPHWRPFVDAADALGVTEPLIRPVLPWQLGPEVLVLDKSLEASFPAGDIIPPVLLAPVTRAVHNLVAVMKVPGYDRQCYHKIEKALKNSHWRRSGIYLTLKTNMESAQYKDLFLRFLDGGFLIPPSIMEPVILPASMSDGEESKLAVLFEHSCPA